MSRLQREILKKKLKKQLMKKKAVIFFVTLLLMMPLLSSGSSLKEVTSAGGMKIENVSPIDYQEGDGPVLVAPDVEITGGGSYGDGYVRFGLNGSTSTERLSFVDSGTPSNENGKVSIVGNAVYLGNGTGYRQIGSVNTSYDGTSGQPLQIDFSTPLVNAGFEEDVKSAEITDRANFGQTHQITGWDITLGEYKVEHLKSGTPGTLVESNDPNYSEFRFQYAVQGEQKSSGNYALRLESLYWVKERRTSHELQDPNFAVFHGPWAISSPFYAYENDTIALDWAAQNGGDDYDVYAFLVNTDTNEEIELFYGRGKTQAWTTTTSTIPTDGNYRFKFISGSYDATGGGKMGASLYIDNIRYYGNAANDAVVQQVARLITYENTASGLDPGAPAKTIEITVKNANNDTATVTETVNNEPLIIYATGDHKDSVTADLTLVTNPADGSTIAWSAEPNIYVNPLTGDPATGEVTRPSHAIGDQLVTLTATITKGEQTTTKVFTVNVKAGDPAPSIQTEWNPLQPVVPGKVQLTVTEEPSPETKFYYQVLGTEPLPKNLGQVVDVSGWTEISQSDSQAVDAVNGSFIEVMEVTEQDGKSTVTKWRVIGPVNDGKALQDAIDRANGELDRAENAQDRYGNAGGEETDSVYTAVESAKNDLQNALDAEPKDKETIHEKTNVLEQAIESLEEASFAKELSNAQELADAALEDATKAIADYKEANGDETAPVFVEVETIKAELEALLDATPPNVPAILDAAERLEEAVIELTKETSNILKDYFLQEIDGLDNVEKMRDLFDAIQEAPLFEEDKQEVLRHLVDKVLEPNSPVVFKDVEDVTKIEESIRQSNKNTAEKEADYIRLTEKAIKELAVADAPADGEKFQKEANKGIEQIIELVTDPEEKERLTHLHELTVDALSLTREKAFQLQDGDTWESITTDFFTLNAGSYGTSISWESSNKQVITISDDTGVVERRKKDQSSILTATISRGDQVVHRTFLLIVKREGAGEKVRESEFREVKVESGTKNVSRQAIERITLSDGNGKVVNIIDKLILTEEMLSEFDFTGETFRILLEDDASVVADELAIEIPFDVLEKINGDLEIWTEYAILYLSKEEILAMQEAKLDLYFRIVPVKDLVEREDVLERLSISDVVKQEVLQVVGVHGVANLLGTPVEIETNYKDFTTDITLPLKDIIYAGIDLDMLRIYIEHSDGEIVVQQGDVVYGENGEPEGLKFTINKFSVFSIFEMEEIPPVEEEEETSPIVTPGTGGQPGSDNGGTDDDDPSSDDGGSESENGGSNNGGIGKKYGDQELPGTATFMYNMLVIGLMILIFGVFLYLDRRKTV
ncbi:immunoglobulin-like domain-containing protein [Evansella tamaricis]|uniref:Uncharacterized protein n=1 Tax=Evansella tamaricis TaxID=2069301 RepID=A0ABS6JE86_9BACI|nr:immunoglobulin-like domain-containing protein [Evansella tamaricis]MBU9711988.1 hypothetical protein [Evansella tamaricis]